MSGTCEIVNTSISTPVLGSSNLDLVLKTDTNTQKIMFANGSNIVPGITLSNNLVGINNINPTYQLDVAGDIRYTGSLIQNGTKLRFCSGTVVTNGSTAVSTTFPFTFSNIPQVTFGITGAANYLLQTNITALSTTGFSVISPCLNIATLTNPVAYYAPVTTYWMAIGS